MSLINWTDNMSVGNNEIDEQHKKLIDIINKLHDQMKIGKGKEILGVIINGLMSYTVFHFSFEEKLFDQYKYTDTLKHKKEHDDLVDQVETFKNKVIKDNTYPTLEIMTFLRDWLTNHILVSDKKYSAFFKEKNIF